LSRFFVSGALTPTSIGQDLNYPEQFLRACFTNTLFKDWLANQPLHQSLNFDNVGAMQWA
jgi:hypothetical protein